jgi:hypothetical protein
MNKEFRHKWQIVPNTKCLERICVKCGAKSSKNFGRDTNWDTPYLKGEFQEHCTK